MCMFSAATDGLFTDFHLVHLGAFSLRGASLNIIEATAVLANGRISPQDCGLWEDSQIAGLKRIVDFCHSQGQKIGIQLAHAGRKASCYAPWIGRGEAAPKEDGGWPDDVMGPSAIPWSSNYPHPREMSLADIQTFITGFRDAAKRAVKAGVDVIEIHGAHGYLLSSFLSPISNQRTDKYGGSFENRIRLLVETIEAIRSVIPKGMPLVLRVSATEWMERQAAHSWDVESTIKLAKLLPALGVDLLDISSGGNNEKQEVRLFGVGQIDIAGQVRNALFEAGVKGLLIGAVGLITEEETAKEILELKKGVKGDGQVTIENEHGGRVKADVVSVGRQFLREPEWVLRVAHNLGVKVGWPVQYDSWTRGFKGSKI